jgi:branched-chain amino acid aminotransferase
MTKSQGTVSQAQDIQDRSVSKRPDFELDPSKLEFGRVFCPNMFITEYAGGEWREPRIEPLHSLQLHPAAMALHYGQAIFEGLKAFRQADGRIAVFRPDANARRLNRSALVLDMPQVPEELFVEATRRLVDTERDYVPDEPGSLYIRPTMIASEACLGVRSSTEYIFYMLALPTGSYFKETSGGAGSVKVLISESAVRAFPGGTDAAKAAGNYAASLRITSRAKSLGCSQVLFLSATDRRSVEEMGGMNILFVRDGVLVTPPLGDTILHGVTRDSVLTCAADLGIPVQETALDMHEILEGIQNGAVSEGIACGTAAVLTGINSFVRESGETIPFRSPAPGPVAGRLYDYIQDVQRGRQRDTRGWLHYV